MENSRLALFVRCTSWDILPNEEELMEHFTCYGQVKSISISHPKDGSECWFAVIRFLTAKGAALTYENRNVEMIRCFGGSFLHIDVYRQRKKKRKTTPFEKCQLTPKPLGVPRLGVALPVQRFEIPDIIPIVKKKARCKRKTREHNIVQKWTSTVAKKNMKPTPPPKSKYEQMKTARRSEGVKDDLDLIVDYINGKSLEAPPVAGSDDWNILESDISYGETIGEGAKSTVYSGTLIRGQRSIPVALKKYRMARMSQRNQNKIKQEAAALSKLDNNYILKYFGTCNGQKTIVMEQMGYTLNASGETFTVYNLREYMDEAERGLDDKKRIKIALDAAKGMEYLHGSGIVHRDLKSPNILLKGEEGGEITAKIGDFGEARKRVEEGLMSLDTLGGRKMVGTIPYMSPEAINCNPLDMPNDVYAFSMVMYELCNLECRFPWDEEITSGHRSLEAIKQYVMDGMRPKIPEQHSMPSSFVSLMKRCWSQNPNDRPSFNVIVKELQTLYDTLAPIDREITSTKVDKIEGKFTCVPLKFHQGSALEGASDRLAKELCEKGKILKSVQEKEDIFLKKNDARNACMFLSLSMCTSFLRNATNKFHICVEHFRQLAEETISELPSSLNDYRDMDNYYSLEDALSILTHVDSAYDKIMYEQSLEGFPDLENGQSKIEEAIKSVITSVA